MINNTIRKLFGWYVIKTESKNKIFVLNALKENKLMFWGIKADDDYFRIKVSMFSYDRLQSIFGNTVVAESAVGLPFILYKYSRRYGLISGSVIGFAMLFFFSLFAWDVNINGNSVIADSTIRSVLAECGLERGSFIPHIDVNKISYRLIKMLPEVSSASVNISGTVINVDLLERKRPPDIADYLGTYDVIADRDGMIVSVEAYDGYPLVKKGDVVLKGQKLISGRYYSKRDVLIEVKARGKISAMVYESFVYTVPLEYIYREYTGKTDDKFSYNIMGNDIDLFFGSVVPFARYEAELQTQNISFLFLKLPIVKTVLHTREYKNAKTILSVETAKQKALDAFADWYTNDIEGQVTNTSYEFFYDEKLKCVTIHGKADVITDIALGVPCEESEPFRPEYYQG